MLNIISYVGFGLRLLWPGQSLPADADARLAKYAALEPASGHTVSFATALAETMDSLLMLLITPKLIKSKRNPPSLAHSY